MKTHRSGTAIAVLALGGWLILAPQIALAQAFFDQARSFVVDRGCEAHTSIKKKTGPVPLQVGRSYPALGENTQPGGTHAFIEVDGARKWAALDCGHYADAPTDGDTPTEPPATADCLPFFDTQDNPVHVGFGGLADITPPAPEITRFDHAVNATCGPPGKVVSREEFEALLRAHPEVLERIQAFTGRRVFADRPVRSSSADYLEDLTDAWFAVHGFDHILCGEPRPGGKVDGFHFHARYLQLQESGEACRLPNLGQSEVVPGVIYTMGVRMEVGGGMAESPVKGYGLTLSGEDILKVVTRAFAENPTTSTDSVGCLLQVSDDGVDFTTVFVRRKNGIRTFYPDATPDPRRNDPCAQPITLPVVSLNRAPVLVQPINDATAPAGDLTEIVIPADAFTDPDGDRLTLSVTQVDGAPIPDWMAFDAPRHTLLLLPEADQIGTALDLAVVASDGHASVSEEMRIAVVPSPAAGIVIDLDAAMHGPDHPLAHHFSAGLYQIESIGREAGGAFDAWAPTRDGAAWRVSYAVRSSDFLLQVLPTGEHPNAITALDAAPKRMVFALDRDGQVAFSVPREAVGPAQGGVSLRIERLGD